MNQLVHQLHHRVGEVEDHITIVKNHWSQDAFIRTYQYAAGAHAKQKVPGSDLPYIAHLTMVAAEVMAAISADSVDDVDLAVQCALLHDIIEDQGFKHDQLKSDFGLRVADGVQALSKNQELPKQEQMRDSLIRIKAQPKEIWMVKLADRISNLQPPPCYWIREKKTQYREEAIEILDTLGSASKLLASRLGNKIEEYQSFVGFVTHDSNDSRPKSLTKR